MTDKKDEISDWDLCNSTWRRITEKYGETAKASDFDAAERVVVLVWTVSGIIGNGGFEYLFFSDLPGDRNYQMSLEAFKAIGAKEAEKAFEDALAAFPGGEVPVSEGERLATFKLHPESERDQLAARFYAADEEVVSCLSKFIRRSGM